MKVRALDLPGVMLIEPDIYADARGHLLEAWHLGRYAEVGLDGRFVQDTLSRSQAGVLRGLHFQMPEPQGKLVMAVEGELFDVAVDVRRGSPRFGHWTSATLSAENGRQMWLPAGFAHGFCVMRGPAACLYKCTTPYDPGGQRTLRWDDPDIAIAWPTAVPLLSPRDAAAPRLRDLPPESLPRFAGP